MLRPYKSFRFIFGLKIGHADGVSLQLFDIDGLFFVN